MEFIAKTDIEGQVLREFEVVVNEQSDVVIDRPLDRNGGDPGVVVESS